MDRGLLSQHCLPAHQERDLECEGRASGPSRRAVRRDDRPGRHRHADGSPAQARHGRCPDRRAPAELQGERRRADHGVRAFCGAENARSASQRGRDVCAHEREGFPQHRNARHHSEHFRSRSGTAAHPCRGSGARLCAGASDRARRRLCRPRAGPGSPSLRQPRHGHRAWTSAHGRPRGPRRHG